MAYMGLCYPVIADLEDDGSYSNGFKASKAVALEVSPQYTDTTEYNDINDLDPHQEFTYADFTFRTTEDKSEILGKEDSDELEFSDIDEDTFHGFGVIQPMSDGRYSALWLYKVQIWEADGDQDTREDNIEFTVSEYSGRAYPRPDGKWKKRIRFDEKADAIAWLETMASI